jgi:hypothetical protein
MNVFINEEKKISFFSTDINQRCPSRLNICCCRAATENKKLLPRRCRAATVIKKCEPRRCRGGDFENL